jgi:hypothetical protein
MLFHFQGSRVIYEERVIMDEGRRRGERMIMDEGRKRDERPIRDEGRRRDEGMIMDEGRRRDEVRMMNDERMREEDMRRDSANIVCHICSLVLPSESSFQQVNNGYSRCYWARVSIKNPFETNY